MERCSSLSGYMEKLSYGDFEVSFYTEESRLESSIPVFLRCLQLKINKMPKGTLLDWEVINHFKILKYFLID